MKILVVSQALDLREKELGITPAWWQILKGLSELGAEIIAVPYYKRSVQSLWWETYENPNLWKSNAYDRIERWAISLGLGRNKMDFRQRNQKLLRFLLRNSVQTKWAGYLRSILTKEKGVDAVLILTVPLNQFSGIPTMIKREFGIPVVFYDGDTPTSLPSNAGLSFSFYEGADPSEYDAFIVNSKGSAEEVRKLGAKKVYTVYWGADPGVFNSIDGIEKTYDVGFYGIGSKLREEWITRMLVEPSLSGNHDHSRKFAICGRAMDLELGAVQYLDPDALAYRRFYSQSKVALNIVRRPHATVYASSISRIFELASLGCCILSNPYNGVEEWFKVGEEIQIAKEECEIQETYDWLLSDPDARNRMGEAARRRVLREHTHRHRAQQILEILRKP